MGGIGVSDREQVLPDVETPDRRLGRGISGDDRFRIPVVGVVGPRHESEVRWRKWVPEAAAGLIALVFGFDDRRLVSVCVRIAAKVVGIGGERVGWIVRDDGAEVLCERRTAGVGQAATANG